MIEINSLWIGKSLSKLEKLSIQSHLQQGHVYRLWTYSDLDAPNGTIVEDGNEILPESSIFAYEIGLGKGSVSAFSNLFRYKLLAEYGGWWADTDVVALKPFDFTDEFVFASEHNRDWSSCATTCVIKAPKDSKIMQDCYESASKLKEVNGKGLQWGVIGPRLLGNMIDQHELSNYTQSPQTFCPLNWFDAEHDPAVHMNTSYIGSYAVHLWQEMWRRNRKDKDGLYDCSSLYGRLLEWYNVAL